ncbi:MAG: kelch repeat-containing protein [Nitrospira sp.]|nr:kelch repeat-containing protein [Nitrospira sp.]
MRLERLRVIAVCILAAVTVACGGDGGGSGSTGAPPAATPLTGVFLDSPVQGLGYSTTPSGLSGITDANGQFNYDQGDTVTFNLYGRTIGAAVPAAPVVTALSVFNATSLSDPRVLNLSQLLLTLGGNPSGANPITVPATPPANFPSALDFSATNFDTSFPGLTLVSEADATTHLQESFATLSVTLAGSNVGGAVVKSDPAGINCGTVCTAAYIKGSSVTLAATGAGFTGWSGGGCTGTGACVVTLNANVTVTATFGTSLPTMTIPRAGHAAARLANGQVLITGGFSSSVFPGAAINTAELYNPTTNTFTAITGRMQSTRGNHTATLLPDGKVLIAGGQITDNDGDGNDSAELYDPATQTFTAISNRMIVPRGSHVAVLLPNGQVLLAGGFNGGFNDLPVAHNSAELYDPATQTFMAISATMTSNRSDKPAADLIPNGKVLIAGGENPSGTLNTAELYDPASQTFTAISATMTSVRGGHTATLLSNGKVLVTGGADILTARPQPTGHTLSSVETFDPTTQTFTAATPSMGTARAYHQATALADGTVLLTGGINFVSSNSFVVLNTIEIYRP